MCSTPACRRAVPAKARGLGAENSDNGGSENQYYPERYIGLGLHGDLHLDSLKYDANPVSRLRRAAMFSLDDVRWHDPVPAPFNANENESGLVPRSSDEMRYSVSRRRVLLAIVSSHATILEIQ